MRMISTFALSALCLATVVEAADSPVKRFGMKWETIMISSPIAGRFNLQKKNHATDLSAYLAASTPTWPVVVVSAVECGSDADAKGIHVGDILIEFNGVPVIGVTAKIMLEETLRTSTLIPLLILERYGNVDQYFYDLQPGLGSGDFSCG